MCYGASGNPFPWYSWDVCHTGRIMRATSKHEEDYIWFESHARYHALPLRVSIQWFVIKWTVCDKSQSKWNQNVVILIKQNSLEIISCQNSSILIRHSRVSVLTVKPFTRSLKGNVWISMLTGSAHWIVLMNVYGRWYCTVALINYDPRTKIKQTRAKLWWTGIHLHWLNR